MKYVSLTISVVSSFILSAQLSNIPNVIYYDQYENSINPSGSCQNTSVTMILDTYGANIGDPDICTNIFGGTSWAQSPSGLRAAFNSEASARGIAVRDIEHIDGTPQDIRDQLALGIPVIVHGDFTGPGHVLVVKGFTGTHYICNDPAGNWNEHDYWGNPTNASNYCCDLGESIQYSKLAFEEAIIRYGDDIWWHQFINVTGIPNTGGGGTPIPGDGVQPISIVNVNSMAIPTTNFSAVFTDSDEAGGSGLSRSLYSVFDWTGTTWSANQNNGFLCDLFDGSAISPAWTASGGTWSLTANNLVQTNSSVGQANLYTALKQNLSNTYVYHAMVNVNGTGTNAGGGFHIMASSATGANYGDNYLILLKPTQNEIHIHKVAGNTLGAPIKIFTNAGIVNNTWYDIKVMYDRTSGKFWIWKGTSLVGTHTDANSHYSTGIGFAFRAANATVKFNNMKVYRSRLVSSANISVGTATSDIRYQSQLGTATTFGAMIKSFCMDNSNNLSGISSLELQIDWTKPIVTSLYDGSAAADQDLQASLTSFIGKINATDNNTLVVNYQYSLGSAPGLTDIKPWTNNGNSPDVNCTGLALTNGNMVYLNAKVTNEAGLLSDVFSSDGIQVNPAANLIAVNEQFITIFPNPTTELLSISSAVSYDKAIICDASGRVVKIEDYNQSLKNTVNVAQLANGHYTIQLLDKNQSVYHYKFVLAK
jgi:Secretion system C-terminal sorting domain/Peptidase_C39 like family